MKLNNKEKRDIGISTIYYNKKDIDIKKTIKEIKKAYNFNKKLYGKNIKKFNTIIVYSRKEYNKYHSSKKTKNYHISSVRKDKRLLILSPNKISQHSTQKKRILSKNPKT